VQLVRCVFVCDRVITFKLNDLSSRYWHGGSTIWIKFVGQGHRSKSSRSTGAKLSLLRLEVKVKLGKPLSVACKKSKSRLETVCKQVTPACKVVGATSSEGFSRRFIHWATRRCRLATLALSTRHTSTLWSSSRQPATPSCWRSSTSSRRNIWPPSPVLPSPTHPRRFVSSSLFT